MKSICSETCRFESTLTMTCIARHGAPLSQHRYQFEPRHQLRPGSCSPPSPGNPRSSEWLRPVSEVPQARFPHAIICACDIQPEAVEFCRRAFDAEAVVSKEDFAKVSLPGLVDLIWSGSLLTHLDECRATELLRLYHGSLASGGLCVFNAWADFRGVARQPHKDVSTHRSL